MNPTILHHISDLSVITDSVVLAIGVFDGVHLGHQALIRQGQEDAALLNARLVVLTFDPHPLKVLRPETAPRLLTATEHKIRLLALEGVDTVLLLPFDKEFAAQPPEVFIQKLTKACRLVRICVGHEWSFGKNRAGNIDMLKTIGSASGFDVVSIPPIIIDSEPASSTRIRKAIASGDFALAKRCLGRDYAILGTVIHGHHLGTKLGFPTANLSAHSEQFPPNGVYAVKVSIDREWFVGVANIGFRPTVEDEVPERTLEVHLFDFTKDIYGLDIELRFVQYLRPEEKFDGVEALKTQIQKDIEEAKKIFALSLQ
ncbi:MAG: bifunctional riboflavin kinase/FAD synthetase [Chthoniobacterales bacterium]